MPVAVAAQLVSSVRTETSQVSGVSDRNRFSLRGLISHPVIVSEWMLMVMAKI